MWYFKRSIDWKKFTNWVISIDFPDKDIKKWLMKFDLKSQEISYNWSVIKLTLPKDASIKSISFNNSGIVLEGKLWFFTWSWNASYRWLIEAIDKVLKSWSSTIFSDNWNIILAKS